LINCGVITLEIADRTQGKLRGAIATCDCVKGLILKHFGAEVKIFDPIELPMAGSVRDTHPKIMELRALSLWSEGQVWCSAVQSGAARRYHGRDKESN
jgi:hypothetical protein